jgi:hypothetical protein
LQSHSLPGFPFLALVPFCTLSSLKCQVFFVPCREFHPTAHFGGETERNRGKEGGPEGESQRERGKEERGGEVGTRRRGRGQEERKRWRERKLAPPTEQARPNTRARAYANMHNLRARLHAHARTRTRSRTHRHPRAHSHVHTRTRGAGTCCPLAPGCLTRSLICCSHLLRPRHGRCAHMTRALSSRGYALSFRGVMSFTLLPTMRGD